MKRRSWTFPPNCDAGHLYGPNPPRDHHGSRICLQCRTGGRLCAQCHLRPVTRKRAAYCSKACSNASRARPLSERFLDFYQPLGLEECWPWTGTISHTGYGVITDDRHNQMLAHRIAYERLNGPVPFGRSVMHTCDNPPCVNPNHLRVGTQADNNEDKRLKGRHSHGVSHGRAKLTEDNVRVIRKSYPRMTQTALAKRFGIDQTTISNIITKRIWKHVV